MVAPRVEEFVNRACPRLPGVVYSFNIADFKRRNGHLGHLVGDADIVELERLLAELGAHVIVARAHSQRWLLLGPDSAHREVESVLARFARSEPFLVGWEVNATKAEHSRVAREAEPSLIRRAIRCLFAPVRTRAELEEAVARIDANDYALPVNCTVALEDVGASERQPWRCVTHYPRRSPACPFCDARGIDWEDGDGAVYGGDGACKGCGAALSFREVSELLRDRGTPDATRPHGGASLEANATLEDLGFRSIVSVAHTRIAIAQQEEHRVLVSVLRRRLAYDRDVLVPRPPWDLPLLAVRAAWGTEDAPSILVELLPRGRPSTRLEPRGALPPFVVSIAEQFVAAHQAGRVVGELHPALVFVDEAGELVACAQRPLRAEHGARTPSSPQTSTTSGMAPMFFDSVLTPKLVRGDPSPDDAQEDVFRLAVLIWWWRHRRAPFGTTTMDRIQNVMNGTPAYPPRDDLDRLLARAFSREPLDRPTAVEILSALLTIDDGWMPVAEGVPSLASDDPRIARARADAEAMLRFLEERKAAGECVEAILRVGTAIETDATDEDLTRHASVFVTKADGTGDTYSFSGTPEALASSFARRIRPSREAPDARARTALRDELREGARAQATSSTSTMPSRSDAHALVRRIELGLAERVARSPRPDALATSTRASVRVSWRLVSDLEARCERMDVVFSAAVEHRLAARSVPTRLYGESLSRADQEDGAGARRDFPAAPSPQELDALVAEALVAKP